MSNRFRLNPAFVSAVQPAGKTTRFGDGNGLYLVVTPSGGTGGKSWVQRLTVNGAVRELGLGSAREVTLREARRRALQNRRIARRGGDPSRGVPRMPTFAQAFAAVIALRRPMWKDPATMEAQWRASMERYALDRLGRLPVGAVTTGDLLDVLAPLWGSLDAARRLKQRMGLVMQWAVAQGHRCDNPAGEVLVAALPSLERRTTPRVALPYDDVPAALATVRASDAGRSIRLAFEFMVLCAARSGEARQATWDEMDLDGATWTVPAARAKTKRAHRVPLSDRAVAVLREAASLRSSDLVFPSTRQAAVIHRRTFARLMPQLGIAAQPHGFRSSFRDWAAECTDAPREVMEAALAHAIPSATEAAYARSDLFERRRVLMQQWADFLQ